MKNIILNIRVLAVLISSSLALVIQSQAAVVIHFEQVGEDVKVSATGKLSLDPTIATTDSSVNSKFYLWRVGVVDIDTDGSSSLYFNSSLGEFVSTAVISTTIEEAGTEGVDNGVGAFGFMGSSLAWDADDISGGSIGAVSELFWNSSKDYLYVRGVNLADLGVDNFSNQLAWTATTSDTISLQTGARSVSSVPEPTGFLLASFGGLSVLMRRNRMAKI